MTKRLRIIFFVALAYFLVIIPVQSQQQVDLVIESSSEAIQLENNLIVIASDSEVIQLENNKENQSNDTGQNIQIEEIISGLNNVPEITENLSGDNFTNDTTGQNTQINQTPQLIISEIYYDGTEEWIEITNLGSDFSGEVELRTPQINFFPVSLQPYQSIILTKSTQSYSRVSPLAIQEPLTNSFSFTDTKAIFASLLRSGQIIDNFQAETGLVTKYNDKKTSLIKQYNNQIWFITGSNFDINVLSPYIASPGIWENGDFLDTTTGTFSETGTNGNTTTSGNIQTGDSQTTSGSDLGGGGMSGIVDTPTATSPQPDILSITEIFNGTAQFSSFIEIKALQNFSGKIFLTGSLLKSALELDIFLEKQERIIIVHIDNLWLSDQKRQEKPSLDLNTSGYLSLLGQSGQVFDIIQVLSTSGNKSNYNGYISSGYIDIYSKIDSFSPGFDEQFLVYFESIYTYTTGQLVQNTGFSDQTSSGGLSTGLTQNWQDLSGTTVSGYLFNPKDLQITALSHLNPESITIKSNLTSNIDFSKKDRYLISKELSSNNWKTTKRYLTGILPPNGSTTITKSFGFLDKGACIGLFYISTQIDEYCYEPYVEQPLEPEEEIFTGEQEVSQIPHISLIGLLPNTQGKDTQEQVVLFWSTTGDDKNFQLPPKSLYLLNNKTKTYFSGSLQANTGTIFKGSLGLLNKAHCTELRYLDQQLDRFCYPNPKEDQYFATGNFILQTIQKSDFNILQKVGFIVTGSQICVRYYDQMLTCRQLPAAKTSIKLKNENKLYKTYVGLLQNYLIKNRSTLYFNTPITQYFTVLKNAKAQVKDFSSTINISGQQFDIYDLSGQIELTTAPQGLSGKQFQEQRSWIQKFLIWLGV